MQQKYDTGMKRAEDLTNENELLKREIRILKEEQDSLNGTVEMTRSQLQQYREHTKAELRLLQVKRKNYRKRSKSSKP